MGRKEDMDAFWDIGRLIPKKENEHYPSRAKSLKLSEITIHGQPTVSEDSKTLHFVQKNSVVPQAEPPQIYENFTPFIRRVEILPWRSSYSYYEFFCKNALEYNEIRGKECERVPFFSYVAQYSQMSKEQLNWYFWWRENIRNCVYLETDISYIYLYLYEIINLGDKLDTKETLGTMIAIWTNYRDTYPQLDKSLREWVCDYSLLHQVPIQRTNISISNEMMAYATLPEIYLTYDGEKDETLASLLLKYHNGYNYKKSKFYRENTTFYDLHLPICLSRAISKLRLFDGEQVSYKHATRVAFMGALCSYRLRKHIEVDYIPITGNLELKASITNITKYSENKLRSMLDIRSRLTVQNLPSDICALIDSYFEEQFPHAEQLPRRPDYEKLYERPSDDFSLETALKIEKDSREVTEKLVDRFEENVPRETQLDNDTILLNMSKVTKSESKKTVNEPIEEFWNSIEKYLDFWEAILFRNFAEQTRICREKHFLPDAVADEINEKAVDVFGDIVLEETAGGYRIIEDYIELFDKEDKNARS